MKIQKYETREQWLQARKGKITGSGLKDVVTLRGNGRKVGYYQLIADRLAISPDDEDPIERGDRLEPEAVEKFMEMTGKEVNTDLVIWTRDDSDSIALSPDGYIEEKGKIVEAVEVKCLNSASHAEAIVTNKIPKDYEFQVLQYFIVNDDLEQLHFVMYDTRFIDKLQLKVFTVDREELKDDIEMYLKYQRDMLQEIEDIVANLTF